MKKILFFSLLFILNLNSAYIATPSLTKEQLEECKKNIELNCFFNTLKCRANSTLEDFSLELGEATRYFNGVGFSIKIPYYEIHRYRYEGSYYNKSKITGYYLEVTYDDLIDLLCKMLPEFRENTDFSYKIFSKNFVFSEEQIKRSTAEQRKATKAGIIKNFILDLPDEQLIRFLKSEKIIPFTLTKGSKPKYITISEQDLLNHFPLSWIKMENKLSERMLDFFAKYKQKRIDEINKELEDVRLRYAKLLKEKESAKVAIERSLKPKAKEKDRAKEQRDLFKSSVSESSSTESSEFDVDEPELKELDLEIARLKAVSPKRSDTPAPSNI